MSLANFTPREIVGELDRYVVGQHKAKRAVAIALRNRWRRLQVKSELRDEIVPKNIIMVGPTGVGKTEIARRLAKLAQAPFVKVEASKFTEVGYVGRDVDSIVRDLVEAAVQMVRAEQLEQVRTRAVENAERRLLELLASHDKGALRMVPQPTPVGQVGPFLVTSQGAASTARGNSEDSELRARLRRGELDEVMVEIEVQEAPGGPLVSVLGGQGFEEVEGKIKEMFGNLPGMAGKRDRKKLSVAEARRVLEDEEAQKLVDQDQIKRDAVLRAEQSGIVFIDEIDKVAGQRAAGGPDVSREGVQRDLLPIVEGSTVSTRYGAVRTDHVLFIAAGAFHVSKVSDLIPELQGRFPIRVELDPLTRADFVRILTEPRNALTRQYAALMLTEGIELELTKEAIAVVAELAEEANRRAENIGARRLHTIMEALLEELSFTAPERSERKVVIDAADVRRILEPLLANQDLARFIL
ncbi:MAG TPA: ATP-dependent protease ATPase subunit HslU [Polyangiales bacterium]|nr:ATP-dependent protease ATPase subunit HslU [Polyangiales bacterium]